MNLARVIKNILFLLVAVFSGLTLLVITAGVTSVAGLSPFDTSIESVLSHVRTPSLTSLMLFITNIGSPFVLSMVAIILAILLILKRDVYDTLLYMVSILLSVISFVMIKNALHIPRPAQSLIAELSGWSFPSGHATVATAFFFVTAYSFYSWFKTWAGRSAFLALCIIAPLTIAFSRIYLVAHFALDVLAGISLGLLSVSFTVLLFNIFLSEREWWRRKVRHL